VFRIDSLYYFILVRGFRKLSQVMAGPSGEQATAPVLEAPPIDVVKLVAGDPIGRALVASATRLVKAVVAAFDPDWIDLVWMRFARALGGAWEHVHRIQTGRVRDQSLGLALGFAGLLLFAWGTSWR
jgi:NADH-quinone oxidoreductase subunit L